ncbi:hypothetical protein [Acidisoma sp. 7E03]
MPDRQPNPHLSDLVLSPEETLALLQPHLPCPCADCAAVTLMMAAALAVGRHYTADEVGRAWQQVALTGEKVAELTAGLKSRQERALTPQGADISATRRGDISRCKAYRTRGAH